MEENINENSLIISNNNNIELSKEMAADSAKFEAAWFSLPKP